MSGGSRILVVEDDEGIRETLKYHLNAAGFQVLEAADRSRPFADPATGSTGSAKALGILMG